VCGACSEGRGDASSNISRKRRAGVDWAAQVVGLYILVQDRLENDGLMKGALVPAELLALLAAVLGTMGMHQKVESEVTQCHAAVVRKAHRDKAETGGYSIQRGICHRCRLFCDST